jgi:DNA polymerase III epsilon subunit-like protein
MSGFRVETLVLVDTATSGLVFDEAEIWEIASLEATFPELSAQRERSWYVRPERWEEANPVSLRMHGFTRSLLERQGEPLPVVLRSFAEGINWQRSMLAGWGVDFDKGMLTAAFRRCGLEVPFHHRVLDVRSLGFLFHVTARQQPESLSLKGFCLWHELGWDEGQGHLARYRVRRTLEALRLVAQPGLAAERRQQVLARRSSSPRPPTVRC